MSEAKDQPESLLTESDLSKSEASLQRANGLVSARWRPNDKPERDVQLHVLLGDAEFLKIIDFIAHEAMSNWDLSHASARSAILSAIGDPRDLAAVSSAWSDGKRALAGVIVRRRVLDLFRKDTRRAGHISAWLAVPGDEGDVGVPDSCPRSDPRGSLERGERAEAVRTALACFAARGQPQWLQAQLLRRYFIDDISYSELGVELACSQIALRVRVHKAIKALRKHITECHPELVA